MSLLGSMFSVWKHTCCDIMINLQTTAPKYLQEYLGKTIRKPYGKNITAFFPDLNCFHTAGKLNRVTPLRGKVGGHNDSRSVKVCKL